VIIGPTAVGKTDLSIKLAQYFKSEIISADSRQLYKHLNIGTAKPSKEQLQGVKHYFIDFFEPNEEISAGQFSKLALQQLKQLFSQNSIQIITGGSGLYINAVCNGFDEIPEVPYKVREELNTIYQEKGIEFLQKELIEKDPEYFKQVDQHNPQRLIRALEVIRFTNEKYSSFRTKNKVIRPFKSIKIGLEIPREELYERIDYRMDEMIDKGLFEEVESLVKYKGLNALNTVGYKEIFEFFNGNYDKEECIRLLKRNSRRYAKRQMTWFKRD